MRPHRPGPLRGSGSYVLIHLGFMNPVLDKYTASMPISAKAIMYGFCIMYACVSLYTPAQGFGIEHETLEVAATYPFEKAGRAGGDLRVGDRLNHRRPTDPRNGRRRSGWRRERLASDH